jgi:hypothetical protein
MGEPGEVGTGGLKRRVNGVVGRVEEERPIRVVLNEIDRFVGERLCGVGRHGGALGSAQDVLAARAGVGGEGHGPVKEAVEAVETARRRQVFGREADVPLADHRRGVA